MSARAWAVTAAAALALGGAAEARALDFGPPPREDAGDPAVEALDLRRVAFGQRDLRMVLRVRTARAWTPGDLAGRRSLCLVLRPRAGRLCVVAASGREAVLHFAPESGPARVVPAVVTRPDRRSLRAQFAPQALGLKLGPLRWAVESRWEEATDRAPDGGFFRTRVGLLGQPRCFGAAARDPLRPCRNALLRRTIFPSPDDAYLMNNAPCRKLRGQGAFDPCEFGVRAGQARGTFVLVGDSHAMHWRRALEVVAEAQRWRGISIARAGCPFSVQIPRSPALGPGQCARLHRRTLAWLRAHPEVETLFVSNWAPPGSSPIGGNAAYAGGAAQVGAMLDQVPASVRRIYVLRDIPGTTQRAIDCVRARRRRGLPAGRACSTPRAAVLIPDPAATAAAARGPRARRLDFTRFFCDGGRCLPVVGGAYVYKDTDHMNAVFALSLGPFVLRAVRAGRG